MERILNLNSNQSKQATYRGLRPLTVKDDSRTTTIEPIRSLSCLHLEYPVYTGLMLEKLFGRHERTSTHEQLVVIRSTRLFGRDDQQ
jgi:hypothetical protein